MRRLLSAVWHVASPECWYPSMTTKTYILFLACRRGKSCGNVQCVKCYFVVGQVHHPNHFSPVQTRGHNSGAPPSCGTPPPRRPLAFTGMPLLTGHSNKEERGHAPRSCRTASPRWPPRRPPRCRPPRSPRRRSCARPPAGPRRAGRPRRRPALQRTRRWGCPAARCRPRAARAPAQPRLRTLCCSICVHKGGAMSNVHAAEHSRNAEACRRRLPCRHGFGR